MSTLRESEEHLRNSLLTGVSADVTRMCMVWHSLGLDAKSLLERTNGVVRHVEGFLKGLVNEEEELKTKIEKRIEQLAQKIAALSDELSLAPYEPPEHATPFQLNSILPKELAKLREEKAERMKEVDALIEHDRELATKLGELPFAIRPNVIPSRETLKELEAHIELFKTTVIDRKSEFQVLKRRIVELLDSVGVTPDNTFQGDILAEDAETFDLTTRNMEGLRKYCQDLEEIEAKRRRAIEELRGRLLVLWEQLDVDEDIKRNFLEENQGCRQQVIDNFKEKVQQMKELRRANLEKLVEKLREQIREYWDKCYYSEDQKEAFIGFQENDFSEGLLDLHEKELDFLKIYYEDHQKLFQSVERWQGMWTQFLEFERKANDPNRFNNRGGGLLQEEKERKKLAAKLPKVEAELEEQILLWEKENGRQFQVCGVRYMEYVNTQRDNHEIEKQLERESRMRKKQRETEVEMTFGSRPKTPTKRRFCGTTGATTTPGAANATNAKTPTKRQRDESRGGALTPTLNRKFPKLNGTEANTPQQTHTSIRLALSPYRPPVPMTCPAKTKGAANSRMMPRSPGRLAPSSSRRALNELRNDAHANIASYEDFKRGVKPPFRSSSLTDLRNLHLASSGGGGAGAADGEPRSSSATPPDAAAANLAVRSFHEAAF